MNQQRIEAIGQQILAFKGANGAGMLNVKGWSEKLLDSMMANENFRLAALRFTDVAPTLRNDKELMAHLSAYFSNVGGNGMKTILGGTMAGGALFGKVVAPLVRKNIQTMAHTFIAGESVSSSLKTLEKLHQNNVACAVDLLGEAVISQKEAEDFTAAYHHTIEHLALSCASWPAPDYPETDSLGPIARANVSVKLSALYENVKPAAHAETVHVLVEKLSNLLHTAMKHGAYLHVDMEQYALVPLTMEVFRTVLLKREFRAYPHIGIVCQAYLKDGETILSQLIELATERGTPFSIRLVKGAYWDYEQAHAEQQNWPCPVFSHKQQTDINFEKLTRILLNAFPHIRPCIGSHNARSLAHAIACAEESDLAKADVEFQMLYGMAEPFRDALVSMGYRVRQYCPVGEFIPGMSYLVRRLLENTANQSFLRMHGKQEVDVAELLKAPQFDGAKLEHNGELLSASRTPEPIFLNNPLADFSLEKWRFQARQALEDFKEDLDEETGRMVYPIVDGRSLKEFEAPQAHLCPWENSLPLTCVHHATLDDTDTAVASAKKAFPAWREMGPEKRAAILRKAAEYASIPDWQEVFALQVYEAGKDWLHADADIAEGVDFMRYYADEIEHLDRRFQPRSLWGEANRTLYEPRGVCAVIAPWNFPFAISAGMTSAALAAGNTVVYKPAEQTSAIGEKLARIYYAAGVPKEAFQFLPGRGEDVGARLVAHPEVSTIAFTGSRDVGLHILKEAATVHEGQRFLKKCIIEMGGKNAILVDSDADLDEAVPEVVSAAFGFQGQKCSACSRVIVIGSAYAPFIARLKDRVESLQVGSPENPVNDVNAVIDKEAYEKIIAYIAQGKADGSVLAQATAPEGGYFIPPTVFADLKETSTLTTDEIFGPVLCVYKAQSVEEAVTMAMNSDYALTGGVFSRNPETISYVKEHVRVGNLYINRGNTGALVGRQPFGGGALSGTGTKAGGPDYLLNFLEPRVITENTMRRGYAPREG